MLINTPIHDYSVYPRYAALHSPSLGLLSIATTADRAGYSVSVFDAELEQASPEQILLAVRNRNPRWIGINAFSVNISVVTKIITLLALEPNRLMVGGPHPLNVSDSHLTTQFKPADLVIRGDGEIPVLQALAGVPFEDIPGAMQPRFPEMSSRSRLSIAEVLDDTPIIDRQFSHGEPVERLGRSWYSVTFSRGCVFRCTFCAGSSHTSGMPYRAMQHGRIFAELEYLLALGASGIRLADDLPFKGKYALLTFMKQVRQRYASKLAWDLNFPLQYCMSLGDEDWSDLADAGVVRLTLGIEAGDFALRAALGKRIRDEQIWELIAKAESFNIGLKLYFLVGTPNEAASATDHTINLALRVSDRRSSSEWMNAANAEGVRSSLFVYKPMPGSKLWEDLTREGFSEEDLLRYLDFELSVQEFQKHAWQTKLQLAELTPSQLAQRVNVYYEQSEAGDRSGFLRT